LDGRTELLLDATDTRRRLAQQGLALAGAGLIVGGIFFGAISDRTRGAAVAAVIAGAALVVAASRVLVRWEVHYGGHVIRFENSVVFGERLVIDGERISRGVLGYRKVIEGAIRRGTSAGSRVRAESEAGVFRFRCRLTVESA
jgi:hypothetical protein